MKIEKKIFPRGRRAFRLSSGRWASSGSFDEVMELEGPESDPELRPEEKTRRDFKADKNPAAEGGE